MIRNNRSMLIMIVVGSVLLLTLALFWIFTTFCWPKTQFIPKEYIPIEIEDSYIKISSFYWDENLEAEHVDEAYITSSSYVGKIYYATVPIKYEQCFEYKIRLEDYKALLNYLINDQQIYSQKDSSDRTSECQTGIEIFHLGKIKRMFFSVDTGDMYQDTMRLIDQLRKNSAEVTNEK